VYFNNKSLCNKLDIQNKEIFIFCTEQFGNYLEKNKEKLKE